MTAKDDVLLDIEVYHHFLYFHFERVKDGKPIGIEVSRRTDRAEDDGKRETIRRIMLDHRIVTFNGQSYDCPMIWYFINGANNAQMKQASDRIIQGGVKYWDVEDLLGIRIPRFDHVDLFAVKPAPFGSLKTHAGRTHAKRIQDLPIEPDATLTDDDMDLLIDYCANGDIPATRALYDALAEPIKLREALSADYGMNFMCRSDSQCGEAIMKKRVEQITGERPERVSTPAGTTFKIPLPGYLVFTTPPLQDMLGKIQSTDFIVKDDGKVDMPRWLSSAKITIGKGTYAIGIGGLHSTEKSCAVQSDDEFILKDLDVGSFYPAIIINSGLYPKALGRKFLEVFTRVRDERMAAKRAGEKVKAEGLKIALNGCFGKLGSRYSVIYAPHLLTTVTLTGQLVLLMLIERAEQAGIAVVSANTDGVVFRVRRDREHELDAISSQWERDTGFELEASPYQSLYSQSVNTYIAIKPDGSTKRKGILANPRVDGDMRGQLMKNPTMALCSDAVVEYLLHGTPLAETIRACRDIRDFVTVVNVKGGATWCGEYLGKVVRYIWSTAGEEILYKVPHATTGNFKRVSKSEGCRPVMELPDAVPDDLDYDRYIAAAEEILHDIGAVYRPPVVKPLRIFKHSAVLWWAIAV